MLQVVSSQKIALWLGDNEKTVVLLLILNSTQVVETKRSTKTNSKDTQFLGESNF